MKFTKPEKSWILYDVANSAFSLILVTSFMPVIFSSLIAIGQEGVMATSHWGFGVSASSLILALISPLFGTFADNKGKKKILFLLFLLTGLAFTLLLLMIKPGKWVECIILFSIAKIGWHGANLFYDAFIVDITTPQRMDQVSSTGYAYGYIGSVIPFIFSIAIIFFIRWLIRENVMISLISARIIFGLTALWWFIFSIPLLKDVQQKYWVEKKISLIGSFKELSATFREIKKYGRVFLFLVAYFFYIDGVDTIITMATSYGTELKLSMITMISAILMIQILAFPMALAYGKLAEIFGTIRMILIGIGVYGVIVFIAFLMPSFSLGIKTILFWVLAILVATSQGGIQALSRSYFGRIIPQKKSSQFFGFYNVFGKFATVLGPFLLGFIGRLTSDSRYGVLSLLLLFMTGALILLTMNKNEMHSSRQKKVL